MGIAAAALTLAVAVTALAGDATAKDREKLQGSWVLTGISVGGKEVKGDLKEALVITFKGDAVQFKEGDKAAQDGTYKIDAGKDPRHMDLVKEKAGKQDIVGIYALDGDTLKIGFLFQLKKGADDPPVARPKGFDGDTIVMTFKRQPK
jgi:uncharacterized protein (TIGR03067 family)